MAIIECKILAQYAHSTNTSSFVRTICLVEKWIHCRCACPFIEPNQNWTTNVNRMSYFQVQWRATVSACQRSLEPDDLETSRVHANWANIQQITTRLTAGPEDALIEHELSSIIPSLHHMHAMTMFFETRMGMALDSSFLWGILSLLMNVSQDHKSHAMTPADTHNRDSYIDYHSRSCYKTHMP